MPTSCCLDVVHRPRIMAGARIQQKTPLPRPTAQQLHPCGMRRLMRGLYLSVNLCMWPTKCLLPHPPSHDAEKGALLACIRPQITPLHQDACMRINTKGQVPVAMQVLRMQIGLLKNGIGHHACVLWGVGRSVLLYCVCDPRASRVTSYARAAYYSSEVWAQNSNSHVFKWSSVGFTRPY